MIGQSRSHQENVGQSAAGTAWRDDHTLESDWTAGKKPASSIGTQKRSFVWAAVLGGSERGACVDVLAFGDKLGPRVLGRSEDRFAGSVGPPSPVSVHL